MSIYYYENRRPQNHCENNELPDWVEGGSSTPALCMEAFDSLPAMLRGFLNHTCLMWIVADIPQALRQGRSQQDIMNHIRSQEREIILREPEPPKAVRRRRKYS